MRLLALDRPGHGLSSFQPRRTLLDWAADVSQLADHLGLEQFAVSGWSAGGPYALACAFALPERVKAAALLSGAAPLEYLGALRGLPLPNRVLAWSAHYFPWLVINSDASWAEALLVNQRAPCDCSKPPCRRWIGSFWSRARWQR